VLKLNPLSLGRRKRRPMGRKINRRPARRKKR
jgi:hypothetical protein